MLVAKLVLAARLDVGDLATSPGWVTGWGCGCRVVGARDGAGAARLGAKPGYTAPPEGWDAPDARGRLPGIDEGWDYQPGATVADTVRAMARKTVQWDYALAKAYMEEVPPAQRDALAMAQRSQQETGEVARRYAERALGMRNGAEIDLPIAPYQTLGLLTTEEAKKVTRLTGVDAVSSQLYDWAFDRYAPRHIHKSHGDDAAEAKHGQTGVTTEDYAKLPRLILEADRMEDAGVTEAGHRAVLIVKKVGEIEYHAIFEVLAKRRMLSLKTLWKRGRPPVLRP